MNEKIPATSCESTNLSEEKEKVIKQDGDIEEEWTEDDLLWVLAWIELLEERGRLTRDWKSA